MAYRSPFSGIIAPKPSSTSIVCSNIISRLSERDLNRLTNLLYQDVETDMTQPLYRWQHLQEELVLKLPASLQRPRGILSRLAISASKSAFKRGIRIRGLDHCADLCEAHEKLDPRVIRALIVLLGNEVTARVEGFRRLRRSQCPFPPGTEAWLRRLDSILEMWTCPPGVIPEHLPHSHVQRPPATGTGQRLRCEACMLSVVGGRPQLLADLRANMLARAEIREANGDPDPEPRLLRVVDMWIAWFPQVCRAAIRDASDDLKQAVKQLNDERERRRRRKDEKRRNSGRRPRQQVRRKKRRSDKRGLPISHIQSSMEAQHGSQRRSSIATDADAGVDDLVGYVDCAVMSRRPAYDHLSFGPDQERFLQQYRPASSVHPSKSGETRRSDEEPLLGRDPRVQPDDAQSPISSSSRVDQENDSVTGGGIPSKAGNAGDGQPLGATPSEFAHPSMVPRPLNVWKRVSDAVANATNWTDESVHTWRSKGRPVSSRTRRGLGNRDSIPPVPTIPEEHLVSGDLALHGGVAPGRQRQSHDSTRRRPSSHVAASPPRPPSSHYSDVPGPPHSPTIATSALPFGRSRKLEPYVDRPDPWGKVGSPRRERDSAGSSSPSAGRQELRRGNLERLNEENKKMAGGF